MPSDPESRELAAIISAAKRSIAQGINPKISISELSRKYYCVAMRSYIPTLHLTKRNPSWLAWQKPAFQKEFWRIYINESPEAAAYFLGWVKTLPPWVKTQIENLEVTHSSSPALVLVSSPSIAVVLASDQELVHRWPIEENATHVAIAWKCDETPGKKRDESLLICLGDRTVATDKLKQVCRQKGLIPDAIVQYPAQIRNPSNF